MGSEWDKFVAEQGLKTNTVVIGSQMPHVELEDRSLAGSVAQMHSPAQLELYAKTYRELKKVAKLRGWDIGKNTEIEKLDAARMEGSDLLFLFPYKDQYEGDDKGYPLSKNQSHYWANLRSFLEPAGRLMEVGKRAKFTVARLSDTPVGAALVINLAKPTQVRSTRKKKEEE